MANYNWFTKFDWYQKIKNKNKKIFVLLSTTGMWHRCDMTVLYCHMIIGCACIGSIIAFVIILS